MIMKYYNIIIQVLLWVSLSIILNACGTPNSAVYSGAHTQKQLQISGASTAGQLMIERIELTDKKGRNSLSISSGQTFSPLAKIKFKGRGVLKANWVIDGQIIEQVNINLSHGSLLVLNIKPSTRIPTITPGTHKLQLKIMQPVVSFKQPELKIFVSTR